MAIAFIILQEEGNYPGNFRNAYFCEKCARRSGVPLRRFDQDWVEETEEDARKEEEATRKDQESRGVEVNDFPIEILPIQCERCNEVIGFDLADFGV